MGDRRQHTIYGIRIHDRDTEDDPVLATVMYSTNGDCGPWHDMATGHPDFCWEIMEALDLARDIKEGRTNEP